MLKLTMSPGDHIDIGDEIRVVFTGGSANNIHILVDAPRELNIARSSAHGNRKPSPYKPEKQLSEQAKKEIVSIIRREKKQQKLAEK